ncbi:hypothetical protein HK100_003154 [Physocladia obscura]|uniref:GRIP domain-containing protein n=1 Tax=Physocladia obscura TaxID=109957 RepID=A0AAD5T7W1_9FUNG|nr:hypothetical protein HK100_003154 [Physocladia obscura]
MLRFFTQQPHIRTGAFGVLRALPASVGFGSGYITGCIISCASGSVPFAFGPAPTSARAYRSHVPFQPAFQSTGRSVPVRHQSASTAYFNLKRILDESKVRETEYFEPRPEKRRRKRKQSDWRKYMEFVKEQVILAKDLARRSRIAKKTYVNDIADSGSLQSVLNQASAIQQATQRATTAAISSTGGTAVGSGTAAPTPTGGRTEAVSASNQTPIFPPTSPLGPVPIDVAAFEKAISTADKALQEASTLRAQNAALETQLKDLRLKAKLKITQLQRELDAKQQQLSSPLPPLSTVTLSAVGAETTGHQKQQQQQREGLVQTKIATLTETAASFESRITALLTSLATKDAEMTTLTLTNADLSTNLSVVIANAQHSLQTLEEQVSQQASEIIEYKARLDASEKHARSLDAASRELLARIERVDEASKEEAAKSEARVLELEELVEILKASGKSRFSNIGAVSDSAGASREESELYGENGKIATARVGIVGENEFFVPGGGGENKVTLKLLEASVAEKYELKAKLAEAVKAQQQSLVAQHAAESKLESVFKQLDEKTKHVSFLDSEIEKLTILVSNGETNISALEKTVADLKAAASTASSNKDLIRELNTVREKSQADVTELKTQLETLSEVLMKKDSDLVDMQNDLDVAKKIAEEKKDGITFLMDEQIMDLKIQIATKQKENVELLEAQQKSKLQYDTLLKESEEKIRKLKGLLGQASKSLHESKKTAAEKDEEIELLHSQLDILEKQCIEMKASEFEHKSSIDRLLLEIQDEKEISAMKTLQLENYCRDLQSEITRVKADFQSYKIKAHTALQQSSSSANEEKLAELEEINAKLVRERLELRQEATSLNERVQVLTSELNITLDQLTSFESQLKRFEGSSKELALLRHEIEACNRKIELEKNLHFEALRTKELFHKSNIETLKQESIRNTAILQSVIDSHIVEIASLKTLIDNLNNETVTARAAVLQAESEADRAKAIAAQASAAAASGNFAAVLAAAGGAPPRPPASNNGSMHERSSSSMFGSIVGGGFFGSNSSANIATVGAAVASSPVLSSTTIQSPVLSRRPSESVNFAIGRESFADLMGRVALTDGGGGVLPVMGSLNEMSERELLVNFKRVSEMLADAEEQVRKLLEQEKILKEEIRKNERAEKRNELLAKKQNVEYLKNIVLSFLETDAKEQLLPVISKVLELSPEEVKRVKNSIMGMEDEKVRASLPNFGFF